jgi:tetratricopeptide (TPR) repeat protein
MEESLQSGGGTETFPGYRLIRLLGEGSHGTVWLAEQRDPRRPVALKLLRSVAAGPELLSRFRRESALLAMLDHPGIARLYASGVFDTPTGPVPFLAMQYVEGADPLTDAEARALDTRARVSLLVAICHAVHHAHTRGVVHRDLKPRNLLVDRNGVPHLIDLGVAAVSGRDDLTQMTQAGSVLGTFPYMSPEQIAGTADLPDPRWDVYALGAIAYELLSGQQPYPGLAAQTSVVGALRLLSSTRPRPLSRALREAAGDLDTVIMKALATEAHARYASAAALAADLQRWLDHRPIEARRPSLAYAISLFARRHRAIAAAAVVVALTLVVTSAVSIRFALREAEARTQAETRTAERDAVNDFLIDMLVSADPERGGGTGSEITLREWLASTDRAHDADPEMLPAPVRQRLAQTLGAALFNVDEPARARQRLTQAHTLAASLYGEEAPETIAAAIELARTAEGTEAVQAAVADLRHWMAETERRALPSLRVAAGIALSALQEVHGHAAEALDDIQATYAYAETHLGTDHLQTLSALHNVSVLQMARGDFIAAERTVREVHARRAALLGAAHPVTLYSLNHLGALQERMGRPQEAETLYREALEARRRTLGELHPNTLATLNNLSGLLLSQGRLEDAEPLLEQLVVQTRQRFGAEGPRTLFAMGQHAYLLEERGRYAEAETLLREVLAVHERRHGTAHHEQLAPRSNLAMLLSRQNRHAEAVALIARAVADAQVILGAEHPYVGIFRSNQGFILTAAGARERAIRELEAAQPILDRLGAEHPRAVTNRERLQRARAAKTA